MNKGGFSWKRFTGVTKIKQKISRKTGVPLTKSGRQRKLGGMIYKGKGCLVTILVPIFIITVLVLFANAEDNHYARGLVIQALIPNELNVGGREFKTLDNPKGEGVFVYDPRTSFSGVKRNLIWIVIDDEAYPLNGASKNLTPDLKWPREADPDIWKKTSLDPYVATEAINIVFGD